MDDITRTPKETDAASTASMRTTIQPPTGLCPTERGGESRPSRAA
jgi:hypothetical protein